MDFKDLLKEKVKTVDEYLEKYLPSEKEYPQIIFEAMRYSVFAGGKRLRPIMVMEACKAFGGDVEKAMPFACSTSLSISFLVYVAAPPLTFIARTEPPASIADLNTTKSISLTASVISCISMPKRVSGLSEP